eukprot:TRINITY_DN3586_c3_g1_i3.p1 TRINITY_DN3586_c3_g1~~TRINITY_DN3586_c3_g1_i3.p1  ORF type:complete len:136 (+),score=9.66 TRINITY_DN3586_c3_g1_i3:98-505(+)
MRLNSKSSQFRLNPELNHSIQRKHKLFNFHFNYIQFNFTKNPQVFFSTNCKSQEEENYQGLPKELRDLKINKQGDLIDSKGKIINEFGASRFDVAVRAMRGEFDPQQQQINNEQSSGLLMESLVAFPRQYFQKTL